MSEYKSKKVLFFKKGKIFSLGDLITPPIVKFFSRHSIKRQIVVGRVIEYLIVIMFVLSIIFLIRL